MSILNDINTPLEKIPNLTISQREKLQSNNIQTLGALLSQFPLEYEQRDDVNSLASAIRIKKTLVKARVITHSYVFLKRKGRLLVIGIEDTSGKAELHCYGREFFKNTLTVGKDIYIWGSFSKKFNKIICSAFEIITDPSAITQKLSSQQHNKENEKTQDKSTSRVGIVARYRKLEGLSQIAFVNILKKILNTITIEELHPYANKANADIMTREDAIKAIHFPSSMEQLTQARKRFAFDEILLFQLFLKSASHISKSKERVPRVLKNTLTQKLNAGLPFQLTRGQISVINTLQQELSGTHPRTSLLQGDVGSGKTLVALFCALAIVEYGEQVAFAVPSESLAIQHYTRIQEMLLPIGVRVALLTGSTKKPARKQTLALLQTGDIHIIIGTHALYSADVLYKNLGFIIIDEQHRMGVNQRMALIHKGVSETENIYPDVLLMSATPIPRSLALTVYGDMNIVTLKERPAIQQQVQTRLIQYKRRHEVYEKVLEKLGKKEQAFFVLPQIEESEEDKEHKSKGVLSIEKVFPEISKALSPYRVAMLHSALSDDEKVELMKDFEKGTIDALVATTIIEVGIDIAQASSMVIFNAERFGLSTLHQLRGRVGRGSLPGEAILIYKNPLSETAKSRLKTMYEETDGFVIAEHDMNLRGPGDIHQIGTRQSGALLFEFADSFSDIDNTILKKTLDIRNDIMKNDPTLSDECHKRLKYILMDR